MNKKLFNTYIESLTPEHGAEIVKFYKSQGFNTSSRSGLCCKEDCDSWRYYGVNDSGNFDNIPLKDGLNVITLEQAKQLVGESNKVYPRVMLVSDEDDIKTARKRVVFMEKNGQHLAWDGAETIEDSEKIVRAVNWKYAWEVDELKNRFPFELSAENQRRIMKVACGNWRQKLIDKWGDSFFEDKSVIVEQPFYKAMRNACDDEQHQLFDEIFGKDQ